MEIDQLEKTFAQQNQITLSEAIRKFNQKKGENIDYNFLLQMYNDDEYRPIVLEQIDMIQEELKSLMMIRDNFNERIITKAIENVGDSKRESDDTRLARKIIDKEKLLESIIYGPYKYNPLLELNESLYPSKIYPLIYECNSEFKKINKDYIVKVYYENSRTIKSINIKRGMEKYINISRDMIIDIDLRQYPFYVWRLIQTSNRALLSI